MYCEHCKVGMVTQAKPSEVVKNAAYVWSRCLVCSRVYYIGFIKNLLKEPK